MQSDDNLKLTQLNLYFLDSNVGEILRVIMKTDSEYKCKLWDS